MAPFRGAFTKLVTTDTTVQSLVVGGATGAATTGTGGIVAGALILPSNVPSPTTLALYNDAGTLKWNGSAIPAGAGTPAGATGDIQFNTAGAFGADTGVFTYTAASDLLGVNNITSQTGSNLVLTAPAGTATGRSITLTAGGSTDNGSTAGSVTIAAGAPSAGSSTIAGSVTIKSGDVRNNSGSVTITTGAYPDSYATPGTCITIKPSTPTTGDGAPGTAAVGVGVLVEGGPGQAHNNAAGNGQGGAGGTLSVKSGVGGAAIASGNTRLGGDGGALSLLGGDGGAATGSSGTRTGGVGGAVVIGSGAGGTGASANGAAGTITFNIGATTAASVTTSAVFTHATGVALTGAISPTQLISNTDNWNPTGLSTANVIRIDASGAINLTGIVAQASGRMLVLYNTTAFVISLIHDATSTSANRFFCPTAGDFPLTAKGSVWIRYDGTDSRWTVFI